jgi:hypothetical protein
MDLERELRPGNERRRTDEAKPRSTAVVVAGMHRSGTSALVRVLNLLGVDLPAALYPAREDNPVGYWEPLHVVEAHEEFLAAIGSSFDDVSALPEGALRGDSARALEDRLVQILESEFADSRQFVVKDPRLCRLVPLWIAALERFGAVPHFVLPVRNPLEVAASMKLRNEYATTKSLLLWLRHSLEAERHTRGFPRSVVSYEQLLRDWQGTVDKIAHELALVWPRTSHAAHAEIEQFLSPRRRHHSFELSELQARADVVDWVKTTYEVLTAAAEGEQLEQDALDALRGELDRADRAFGPLLAELSLTQRTQEKALSEQAADLSEQAEKLAVVSAVAETRARDLDDRTQALASTSAEVERLRTEMGQREEALAAAAAEAAAAREEVERLEPELAEQMRALGETRAEVERLTGELTGQEEALAAVTTEAAASRGTVERLETELAERERTLGEVESLRAELAQRDEALTTAASEAANSGEQVEQLQAELAEQTIALAETRAEVEGMTAELAQREEALIAAAAQAANSREQVEQLQAELGERERALGEARAEEDGLKGELVQREAERAEADASIRRLEDRVQALTEEAAVRDARAQHALNEVADLRIALTARGGRLETMRALLGESRRQRRGLARELARRTEALAAGEAEAVRLQADTDALRAVVAERDSQASLLVAEKAELAAAVAALEEEANRTGEEARRNAALAEDRQQTLAELQIRRFVRPRTKWLALSQFGSWLTHPHRGGWRLIGRYLRLRRSATFPVEAYLAENPDVDASGLDPLMHYIEHGIHEGRALAPMRSEASAAYAVAGSSPAIEPDEFPASGALDAPTIEPPPPASEPIVAVAPQADQALRPDVPPADYGDFMVLLSRQRSGTNPLRSVLESHPEIFAFTDVFNLPHRDSDEPRLRESNFFTFLERYAKDDVRRTMPDHHERLFLDYLEYLRCLSQKRYTLIDVKYNTTHFLARPWQERGAPYLLELIIKHGLYVLNVTRRNYLRSILSSEKAWHSNCYTVLDGDTDYVDGTRNLDPDFVLRELSHCLDEDRRIQQALTSGDRVRTYDYTEIFSGNGSAISPEFLKQFSDWRGIDNAFASKPAYKKLSSLPLRETIENYDEIAAAVREGPFAYCLEDEPAYRSAEALLAPAVPRGRVVRVSGGDSARDVWRSVIGSDPDSFCTTFYRTRPSWIQGSLSEDDARFLFQQVLNAGADEAVEIGTGTGFSTAVLAHAMHFRAAAGQARHDWRVRSYDFFEHLWFDHGRQVGDAARELLAEPLLARVEFNSPALAADVAERHAANSIRFLFLDANHNHPWPALDLLAVLEVLGAGGVVVLHDVNLPRIHPEFPEWGVNRVFEELNIEKIVPDVELPNIGAFVVPNAKGPVRDQLIRIVERHPWEVDVPDDFVEGLVGGAGRRSG